MKCTNCGKETTNKKFCSRSCSAKVTNKVPKRVRTNKCSKCNSLARSYRATLCKYHCEEYKRNKIFEYKSKTLGEYKSIQIKKGHHPSWHGVRIRIYSRQWNKELTKEPCRHCGYSKHVEMAHIKSVSEFSDDTPLSEINSKENLIPLCPNCHWEFDNLPRNRL